MPPTFEIPISRNKIRVPVRRRELVTRPRLMDALYDQIEKRIVIVVAPAGYGKTSLLIDFASQTDLPVCWLSLDELDQDPQRFLRYLIAAISSRFPSFGKDSLAALESMSSLEKDEERLLVTITNEINAQIEDHFLLILDDYHTVGETPFIGHVIGRFLQLVGEHAHLVIASRNIPELSDTPLLVARNQLGGLSFEDLSFSSEEIQQFFLQNNGLDLSKKDADELVEQTEGWIAAIHLTGGQAVSLPKLHPLESTRELFDFFSKEILSLQPEQVRRFLLFTSMFDTFDVTLCQKVLDPLMDEDVYDWQYLFELVQSSNLFSVPLDEDGRWIRYHHLFRYFLRARLQYEEPAMAWHIQVNLAHVYEQQQLWEEALQIYAGLEDYKNQARLLIKTGLLFILSGNLLTLSNWLEKLPSNVVFSNPGLLSLLGVIHNSKGDNRRALELFNFAEAGLRGTDNENDWTATLVRRAEVYRQMGQFEQALSDIDRILEITQNAEALEMQYTYAEAQRVRGLALFGLGNVNEALIWLQRALETYRNAGIWKNIPILETEIGVVYRRMGEPGIAAQFYSSALKAWENAGNTGWKARLLNNMGLLYHMTGKLEDAHAALTEALDIAERSGFTRICTNVLISLGDLLTDITDYEMAYDYYDRALTLATTLGHSRYIFYASMGEARLQRMSGELHLAIEELKHAEVSQFNMGKYERALFNLELGCCWLEDKKMDAALVVLRDAVALFGDGGNQMEEVIARLWLEVALYGQSPDESVAGLRKLIPPKREWKKTTPLVLHMGKAYRWLKSQDGRIQFGDPVLDAFLQEAERVLAGMYELAGRIRQKANSRSQTSPQLEIVSFGDVQVRRDQRIVKTSEWQTREARDLFFFLLQAPPLTKEQIGLEFWPDISPARLKMRFKINIYRIRRALGQDVILYENDKYRFNRRVNYSWDRDELDELLKSLRNIRGEEKVVPLEKAIRIIRGTYLSDLDAEWAVSDRLKYQDVFVELAVELAGLYLKEGRPRDCLQTAKNVLQTDPLLEDANRLIIQAYANLHDPAGMTLQYRQYQKIMMTELGLQPSSEFSALYEQLLGTI